MGEVIKLDLKKKSLRDVNSVLQNLDPKSNLRNYLISNPIRFDMCKRNC
mgnify:CR=1 FL=1